MPSDSASKGRNCTDDEVALEELAGLGHELLVVGVRVVQHDVVHALALQLLGEGLHAVEVHARGDEVDARRPSSR